MSVDLFLELLNLRLDLKENQLYSIMLT